MTCIPSKPLLSIFCFLNVRNNGQVVMKNEIVEVNISNPQGMVTGIRFNGIDNLLEFRADESNRGYMI